MATWYEQLERAIEKEAPKMVGRGCLVPLTSFFLLVAIACLVVF